MRCAPDPGSGSSARATSTPSPAAPRGPDHARLRRPPGPRHPARAALARRRDLGLRRGRRAGLDLPCRCQPRPGSGDAGVASTPSPPARSRRAGSAARSSAPSRTCRHLWQFLGPEWGPARSVRPRQPFMVLDQRAGGGAVAARTPGASRRARPPLPGVRGDVHRGARRLARGQRRAPALPGTGRPADRQGSRVRAHRGRRGALQGRARGDHSARVPAAERLGRRRGCAVRDWRRAESPPSARRRSRTWPRWSRCTSTSTTSRAQRSYARAGFVTTGMFATILF